MLKLRLIPIILALLSIPALAGAQLVDFYGYTWDPGATGSELRLLGNVDQIFSPLASIFQKIEVSRNQRTWKSSLARRLTRRVSGRPITAVGSFELISSKRAAPRPSARY